MDEGLTREEIRALAGEVLNALGLQKPEQTDEEREAVRRAIDGYRRRKAAQGNDGSSEGT